MFTIEQVKKELEELSGMMRDEFNIPVRINNRLTKTLGRVISKCDLNGLYCPDYMEFSQTLLSKANENSVMQVIRHEWCHYYLTKTTKEAHGHDSLFKALCDRVGCSGKTSTKVQYTEADENIFKYTVHCPDCGKVIARYSRMNKTLKQLHNCHCAKCGSHNLYYKQNW